MSNTRYRIVPATLFTGVSNKLLYKLEKREPGFYGWCLGWLYVAMADTKAELEKVIEHLKGA